MNLGLEDKVAVVTGGARGIGAAIVEGLVQEGVNVIIGDVIVDAVQDLVKKLGGEGTRVLAIKTDVTKKTDVDNLASVAMSKYGKIDILVNNAGVVRNIMFLDIGEEEWDRVNEVNAKGTYLVTRAIIPFMIKAKQGRVVNVSSVAGKEGFEGHSHYCASKFAVIGLTQALAKELAEFNITVNAVCPGILRTQMWEGMLDTLTEREREGRSRNEIFDDWVERLIPLKKPQTPEDIANAVLFLSSGVSKNITGQSICVDGGIIMH